MTSEVQAQSMKSQATDGPEPGPSPFCAPYLTRKQTEELWRLLHQQPQKKWAPHRRALLKALQRNAGNKHYLEKP